MSRDLRTLIAGAAASGLLAAGSPVTAADRAWTEVKSTHLSSSPTLASRRRATPCGSWNNFATR